MPYGRTIRIYLADGTPSGIRHAELVNWTGQAIVCPRGRLAELDDWAESQRPGVYVLVGDEAGGRMERAYVGEAENVLQRIKSHVQNKDFWTRGVLFTSKDENLTKSHVKYLESRIVEIAAKANRYTLENSNSPRPPSLPRSEKDSMEEFLGPVTTLLGSLGFPLLQSVGHGRSSSSGDDDRTLHFRNSKRGVTASGTSVDEGFIVYSGSVGTVELRDHLGKGYLALRNELLANGSLKETGEQLKVIRDILFSSPSAAACVLAGGAYNGREAWKNSSGVSLKQIEEGAALPDQRE